jgi:hypothetical protein
MRLLRIFASVAKRIAIWCLIFFLELGATVTLFVVARIFFTTHSSGWMVHEVRVSGTPSVHPQLEFACELSTDSLQHLFSNAGVISDLKTLNAGVSVALSDLSRGRAEVVQRLNRADVPVAAWLALPSEQGYYINAGNALAARERFAQFERWTAEYGLRWTGVGLDIEPSLQDFAALRTGAKWHLLTTVIGRCFDGGRVRHARDAYSAFIKEIQARGYSVDTYQFPFIVDERQVHSMLLERLFGVVDVRGNREVLMLYSSFNHVADSGLIWEYGPEAQAIVIGSTRLDPSLPTKFAPLDWNEFTRDLIVASHFTSVVGIYSLEGCVQQGYLARLRTMNGFQRVAIRSEAIRTVALLRARIRAVLWPLSHLLYLAVGLIILDTCAWLIWRRRARKMG